MNASSFPPSSALSIRSLLGDLQSFARREPVQAMALAVGAGLLVNLLPKRAVANTAATLGSALLHPALLALGLTKALELCCQANRSHTSPPHLEGPSHSDLGFGEVSTSSRPSQWIKP